MNAFADYKAWNIGARIDCMRPYCAPIRKLPCGKVAADPACADLKWRDGDDWEVPIQLSELSDGGSMVEISITPKAAGIYA